MPSRAEQAKAALIERASEIARGRLGEKRGAQAAHFVKAFYANVPPDDLLGEEPETLFAAALALWTFGAERMPGTAKVRIFNPNPDEHGWRSSHTIVEIVNDDMPFLVDSVTAAINQRDLTVHLVIHPVVRVERDAKGRIVATDSKDAAPESFMQLRIDELLDPKRHTEIAAVIERVLGDVRNAVTDWRPMLAKVEETLEEIATETTNLPDEQTDEARSFLQWLPDDHYIFLGYREYDIAGEGDSQSLSIRRGSGLGVLRDETISVFDGLRNLDTLPADLRQFLKQSRLLIVTKANHRATVHRPVHMDSIVVKRFDNKGRIFGERLFVGLLTSVAYNRSPRDTPILRRKVAHVLERSGFSPRSHDGKALAHILETYPRDELFQISEDELFQIALGILHLQERQRTALFVRRDPFERFISALVYLPRDRFTTDLRLRVQDILATAYKGKVDAFYTQMTDAALGRLHIIVSTTPGAVPDVDVNELEAKIAEATRSWRDHLQEALIESKGEALGLQLLQRYGNAFPVAYRDRFSARAAVLDIDRIEQAIAGGTVALNLYRPIEAAPDELRFKIYNAGDQLALSEILPMLEHMGLRVIGEVPFTIEPAGLGRVVWLHDFGMRTADGSSVDLASAKERFQDAYARVWLGEAEADGFNRLILQAGLDWRDVAMLRAYAKYLRQTGAAFSQAYMEETLARNGTIAAALVNLFRVRFDPAGQDRDQRALAIRAGIERAFDAVTSLDEDRILRRFLNLIEASLRTNFFQKQENGQPKPYLSVKLDSRIVEELPLPRPMVEIFVYSTRVEAVHLRGGKVARGGIRWSDRREDFRAEVLGLLKAQMVKNAVIVPVGSKGGFVVKRPPSSGGREALMEEVVYCYKTMMRGLLDITDNRSGDKILPPPDVVRHDEDDPYLVVAADKGTATFSDIANGVAAEYQYWLGDAFASGGSAGYDHKKMGITARGGWESVKRHFRELDVDIQNQDFTVIGVGDMSGDVFGNGMLLSEHIKLLGAFNHLHIFVDPDPDPKASFAERKRLFDLPRSSWRDYDPKLISAGGGVFDRSAKTVAVSPQVKAAFGLDAASVSPSDLIRAILKAKVDLLWLGGIGTYVKATAESQVSVGDRGNDALRINAERLRCRVVGEGANLGFTQRGRIAYAQAGGWINTDAIDNSAGVDCSDHEVNIKILLNGLVDAGDLTVKQRDELLETMTEEVAELVLRDNYLQTQAISIWRKNDWLRLDQQGRFMRALERSGQLDRSLEYLPDDETIQERIALRQGLTRSELAVLLAYAKISLYHELLPSDLPDDPQLIDDLVRYFPTPLQQRFRDAIPQHRLRREIIASVVTNSLVNRVGPTFLYVMKEKTGCDAAAIARAYATTRAVFDLRSYWSQIEGLDNKVPASVQISMLDTTVDIAEAGTLWFLRNARGAADLPGGIEVHRNGIAELAATLGSVGTDEDRAEIEQRVITYRRDGVPEDLARRMTALDRLGSGLDIVEIANRGGHKLADVARIYFSVGDRFHLDWLRRASREVNLDTHWDRMAVAAVIDDLYLHQRELTHGVLTNGAAAGAEPVDRWMSERAIAVRRIEALFAELRHTGGFDLAKLAVANRELRLLTDS
ncbi:MAG: NAD-glutamate dehydrogenase [Rhodospirillaceae bacterium]|nr:NAD-glutamate dehydrogenase [Rhodospirillaceae bacterium]